MTEEIPERGQVEPVFQQVGWKVCKVSSEKEEDQEWIPVEKISEAEILSYIYKQ